ncbi:hypothetical protein INT45_005893 [Circinella minor]|uniref:Uncharacterized protein n=1 Tax=Circinella minor TaxID=1195481 RepID=A0A8H7VI66_9FUNG|nr:hypothetical protein INT45_005893 [Circinella minor]
MQKALSHRHSFPPPSHRFSSQQDNLIASPSSPVFDSGGDINAANMVNGMNTPTVAAAATPGVDPGTTSRTTPSSRFSEIEQVLPSDPRLVSVIASPQPSSSTADRLQHSQRQPKQQHIEPFISSLTEANLKFHTNSYSNSKETRKFYVDSYVETQANVIQLETKLQRRRRAEIRSLVPLDILSLSDEVIIQQPVTQLIVENLTTTLADNTTNNNNNNSSVNNNNNQKKRRKWFPRWLMPVRFKRKQGEERQEKQHKQELGKHQHASLEITAMGKEEGTLINNNAVNQQPLQQRRYSSTSPTKASAITPTTATPPVSTPPHVERNSWAAPETSYQQYQNEKLELLHEGLCGLNNVNILRALGEHNRAVTGKGERAGTTTSMIILSSQPQLQEQQQLRHQDIKRDSGVSFTTQQQHANNSNKSRRRFSTRLRSVREQDEQEQQQQQNQLGNTSTLIGFRYPRMVHRKTLRDAAIYVLSSELSFYENEDYFDDHGYVDEMDNHHDQA